MVARERLAPLRGRIRRASALLSWAAWGTALAAVPARASDIIPVPDFTDYRVPISVPPAVEHPGWEWLSVLLLALALCLASYLALARRSRRGVYALTVACLLWFGFFREGCVCPIGAIQNVALALGDPGYALPASVLLFFLLPVVFTLFFGRTFCAAVCPLGAVQEVVAVRPVQVPRWLDHGLGLIPFFYLGLALLYAATATGFVVCRYDPFVAMFRLSGNFNMLVFGAAVVLIGVFVGRPYCRYLCPLGAELAVCSRASKWHVRIAPTECTRCRLCESSCPYGAIELPTRPLPNRMRPAARTRLATALGLAPLLVLAGVLVGGLLALPLARLHPEDRLAERVLREDQGLVEGTTDASEAFRNTGRPVEELVADVLAIRAGFRLGGRWLGAWMGLVVGLKLIALTVRGKREDYLPDRGRCVSCGRCYKYCPEEQMTLGDLREQAEWESAETAEVASP